MSNPGNTGGSSGNKQENSGNMEEILGTLELDGKFVGQNGSIISFAANKTVTVQGWVVDEEGNWSTTEHTGNLKVKNWSIP